MRKLQRLMSCFLAVVLCMQITTATVYYSGEKQKVFAAEEFVYGDLNGDNLLNSTDLTLLKRYLMKKITDFPVEDDIKSADLNGDGEINSTDLTLMNRKLLKTIEYFPVEEPTATPTEEPTATPTIINNK